MKQMTKPPFTMSRAWREQVAGGIINGYGVEDIAIYLGCHVSHVRNYVSQLRAEGWLEKWFKKGE